MKNGGFTLVEGLGTTVECGTNGLFKNSLGMLRRHAADRVPLKEILASLQVSHYTLMRIFLTHLGRTPSQELARIRLEHAKSLLITTDLPFNTVAQLCGFKSHANFGDYICRYTGLTPGTFRRRHFHLGHNTK